MKSTRIADHFGILDIEERFISSRENITSIWTTFFRIGRPADCAHTTTNFQKFAKNQKIQLVAWGLWNSKAKRLNFMWIIYIFLRTQQIWMNSIEICNSLIFSVNLRGYQHLAKKPKLLYMWFIFYWNLHILPNILVCETLKNDSFQVEKILHQYGRFVNYKIWNWMWLWSQEMLSRRAVDIFEKFGNNPKMHIKWPGLLQSKAKTL